MTFDFKDGNGPVPAHQHPNGGGWVADTASVADTAYVGPDAWVYGNAKVTGNAEVFGNARVFGNAEVFGNARVFGDDQKTNKMNNGDNKMTDLLKINAIMLELAETGKVTIPQDMWWNYGWSGIEPDIRQAAREDGVQVRFTYDSDDNLTVTLRKIGLGH